jgi:integrase
MKHFKFTDSGLRKLHAPATSMDLYYDTEVPGLCFRITDGGARAFTLRYRTSAGRERYFTIGRFSMTSVPEWSVAAARTRASELKERIRLGFDPQDAARAERDALTVRELVDRFIEEHLPRLRPSTRSDYGNLIKHDIVPALGRKKVGEVAFADIDKLHRKKTREGAPYRANMAVAVARKIFNFAIKLKLRTDNPCIGVERNQEPKRQRYLSAAELRRLTEALAAHSDQQAADIFRLLLLTGARRGEVQSVRWADLDLTKGEWTKPASTTKQKQFHHVPLSAPALQLLCELQRKADEARDEARKEDRGAKEESVFVFPARSKTGHRVEIAKNWRELCKAAKIKKARIHDLRHTYASILASAGLSLPIIGRLLGHSNPSTTARYAHLYDDPLREATERVGAILSGRPSAEVIPLRGTRG